MTTHSNQDDAARAAAKAFRAALDRAASEESAAHLTYEDIEAHVDGRLDGEERARVTTHLRECSACTEDVQQIEALRREMYVEPEHPPVTARLTRILCSWRPWDLRILVPVAACALLIAFFVREQPPPDVEQRSTSRVDAPPRPASETLPQPYRQLVEQAVSTRRLEVPASIADLTGRGGVLLGAPSEAKTVGGLHPVGTVVETDRPTFTWVGPGGAQYKVSVYDDRFNEASTSGWIGTTQWTMPKSLTRGARYSWQLTVRRGETETIVPAPPAPEARFQVLGVEDLKELSAVRETHGDAHLLLAVLYARLGLLDAAEAELQALAAAEPNSPIVAGLSTSLKKARGL